MQVYSNLPRGKSHVVNTSWAMLTLMAAGQVHSLKPFPDANSNSSLRTSNALLSNISRSCKIWSSIYPLFGFPHPEAKCLCLCYVNYEISKVLINFLYQRKIRYWLVSIRLKISGREILNRCIKQQFHLLISKQKLEIFLNRYFSVSCELEQCRVGIRFVTVAIVLVWPASKGGSPKYSLLVNLFLRVTEGWQAFHLNAGNHGRIQQELYDQLLSVSMHFPYMGFGWVPAKSNGLMQLLDFVHMAEDRFIIYWKAHGLRVLFFSILKRSTTSDKVVLCPLGEIVYTCPTRACAGPLFSDRLVFSIYLFSMPLPQSRLWVPPACVKRVLEAPVYCTQISLYRSRFHGQLCRSFSTPLT